MMQSRNTAWTGGRRAGRMKYLIVYFAWRIVEGGIKCLFLCLLLKEDVAAVEVFNFGLLCTQEGPQEG